MTDPLTAAGRITIPYTVGGFLHKFRAYCRNPTVAGATFNINSRASDANDTDWMAAANDLGTTLSYLMGAGYVFGDATLERQSGGIFTPLQTHTLVITDHVFGTPWLGWQNTLVLRDLNLYKLKFVVLDSNDGDLSHYVSWASIAKARVKSFCQEFLSNKTLTNAPYNWAVSRGNQYINTGAFVGETSTTNRRSRRRRGLT